MSKRGTVPYGVAVPDNDPVRGLLTDRSAVVTGAGRGLGRAIAIRLAAAGSKVIVNDIDAESAAATAADIVAVGGVAEPIAGDISIEADVETLVAAAVDRFGSLDLACNNALPEVRLAELTELDVDYARHLSSVAVVGTAMCLKHELKAMQSTGGGAIVNISSTASARGQKRTGFYAGCKAAIEAMTLVAANENGAKGIRVNAIQAGGMLTPALIEALLHSDERRAELSARIPLGKLAEPEEVADVAVFLLSDLARYVTGAVLRADGGGILHAS